MSSKKPEVSVIIPVYNVAQYLEQCIDSVLQQTLRRIEIILVDDQSQDSSPQICDAYAARHENIRVIHKKNQGLGMARNSGLEIATGEYVAFVDSDDFIAPQTYEALLDEQYDAVFFAYDRVLNDQIIGSNPDSGFETATNRPSIERFILDMIANPPQMRRERNFQVSACCALYRRSIIEQYGLRFRSEREIISEDLFFNIDFLMHASRIKRTERTFYHYRVNALSLSQNVRLDRIERNIYLYEALSEKLGSYGIDPVAARQRSVRLLIGYSRGSIRQVCKSGMKYREKRAWLNSVCDNPIWCELAAIYPCHSMPTVHRLHFRLLAGRHISLLYLLSSL